MAVDPRPEAPRMAYVRCLDIAEHWLRAYGRDSRSSRAGIFTDFSDETLSDACVTKWGLDQPQGEENDLNWFETHETSRDLLIWAFAALRAFESNHI